MTILEIILIWVVFLISLALLIVVTLSKETSGLPKYKSPPKPPKKE